MMGTARMLAWRKARPCCRRAPAAAVRSSRILRHSSSSAALAAAAAALIPAKRSLLARAKESSDCLALEGSAPCGHTVAAGAGDGTAGPAGPPGSLIAVCVASVGGQSVRPGKS
jgi:hypothetical protein